MIIKIVEISTTRLTIWMPNFSQESHLWWLQWILFWKCQVSFEEAALATERGN